ncbi:adenylate isopentenyltransferase-like [Bidens hawaiensis]|uniref:adenylate isopentenyltransferase-like n=1 Tax=Bidens hawaiensis TaxID=980011 RepID=UPI00404963B8
MGHSMLAAAEETITNPLNKQKIVVIMGSTGTGKSRLSIDLVSRFFKNCEIINCDKMQVYDRLDITTNKVTMQEQFGVPHHLLGGIDPTMWVFTASDFRKVASEIISDIKSRHGLPVVVGGSSSLIYSLVANDYDPKLDVFNVHGMDPSALELRYACCFIWINVELPVLNKYLSKRVDEMLDSGMFKELQEFFLSGEYTRVKRSGLGQSIGVPEFETYFKKFPGFERISDIDSEGQKEAYNEAVKCIKKNTYQLAEKQVNKILRLMNLGGWDVKRIDATEAFRAVINSAKDPKDADGAKMADIWEKQVVLPSMKIVKHFLDE